MKSGPKAAGGAGRQALEMAVQRQEMRARCSLLRQRLESDGDETNGEPEEVPA
jgi:hypothetical protein